MDLCRRSVLTYTHTCEHTHTHAHSVIVRKEGFGKKGVNGRRGVKMG